MFDQYKNQYKRVLPEGLNSTNELIHPIRNKDLILTLYKTLFDESKNRNTKEPIINLEQGSDHKLTDGFYRFL